MRYIENRNEAEIYRMLGGLRHLRNLTIKLRFIQRWPSKTSAQDPNKSDWRYIGPCDYTQEVLRYIPVHADLVRSIFRIISTAQWEHTTEASLQSLTVLPVISSKLLAEFEDVTGAQMELSFFGWLARSWVCRIWKWCDSFDPCDRLYMREVFANERERFAQEAKEFRYSAKVGRQAGLVNTCWRSVWPDFGADSMESWTSIPISGQ